MSENFMPRVYGKAFCCDCGCNVFQKPTGDPNLYECNGCQARFRGEPFSTTNQGPGTLAPDPAE